MTAIYFFLGVVGWCFLWMIWYITWIWIHITDFMWYDVVLLIDLLTDCMSFWKFFLCFDWLVDWVSFWFDSWLGWWTHWFIDSLSLLCLNWVAFVDWLIEIWNWNWNWNWLFDVTWLVDWLIDQLIVWLIVLLIGWCFDFDMRQTSIPISPCVLDQESAECMWEAIHKRHPCDFWSNLVSTKWNHKL